MACLARTRARDTRVSEFLVAPGAQFGCTVVRFGCTVVRFGCTGEQFCLHRENSFACTGRKLLGRITNPTEPKNPTASTCENVPGPGTFLCGPLLQKSGPLFQKSGLLFQKSGPLFFTSGPLFQQNDLFWSFILSPTVFLLSSTHHSPPPVQPKERSRACVACARVWHTIIKHFSSEKICWFRKMSYLCACHPRHDTEQQAQ